jgi:hypothetical protein
MYAASLPVEKTFTTVHQNDKSKTDTISKAMMMLLQWPVYTHPKPALSVDVLNKGCYFRLKQHFRLNQAWAI